MESTAFSFRALEFGRQCAEVPFENLGRELGRKSGLLWVHIVAHEREATEALLLETFGFAPLEVEDALSPHERPSLRVDEESMFLVTPSVVLGGTKERFVEVAIFVSTHVLVTVVSEELPALDHWLDRCAAKPAAAGGSVAFLLHSIVDTIVDGYFPAIDALGEEIDDLEESIYSARRVDVADALLLKRRLLEMRRQISPIRDILNGMLRRDVGFAEGPVRAHFQDVYDHSLRITEVIDMERDILASVLDAHLSIVSNNLNQVMRTLTVISTVLMTGAFVAGVYGMNFKHMPELDWLFGYPFAVLVMIGIGMLEVWFFRKKGWI